ncbi:MAG: M3 family oligoendopeptidase [Planctomycetia bacterium]|nr:M3 family oligoendopeptidase [Planctomycetia bacterium]
MIQQLADSPTCWDLSNVYSSLEGSDFQAAMADVSRQLDDLEKFYDAHQVRRQPAPPPGDDAAIARTLEEAIERVNRLGKLIETLDSFVYAFVSTNSYDAVASREYSKLDLLSTRRAKLRVRLAGWIGSLGPRLAAIVPQRPALQQHTFFLTDTAEQSKYLMSDELEALAAELCVDGGLAFGKQQGNVTSQLKVPFERDGKVEELPVTVVRNFSFSPDAGLRRRGYDAELKAWHSVRTPIAASINAVKGTAVTLARRRGRPSVLDAALVNNRIRRPTLDALLSTIREFFPVFRRYLRSKARKLGQEQLPWWDLFAPVGAIHRSFSWREARNFVVEKFGTFSPELGAFAAAAFDRNWIDGAPRDGKRGGAFCMPVVGVDESRILANFDGSFEQVSTLAHELGHGYHNHCQRGLPVLLRGSPSTLAETASIFCETLVAEAALAESPPAEQLGILEVQLCGATQVCLDISSRFLFESAFIARRAECELSPDEICELIQKAQAETYSDAVRPDTYHRYMWLWKPHYYSHDENFYNFPYAFGHLFGLGLFAQYRREGKPFIPRYETLLRDTNTDYAEPLATRFGIDITKPDFWRQSLRVIESQVERYEKL